MSDETIEFDDTAPEPFSNTRADLAQARVGDPGAFTRLWAGSMRGLEVFLLGRGAARVPAGLQRRFRSEMDDIIQECGIIVFKQLGKFEYRGNGSFSAWIRGIATLIIQDWIDHCTAGKRRPRSEISLDDHATREVATKIRELTIIPATGTGPTTAARRSELQEKVASALEHLNDREYEIVMLWIFGDASWREVAQTVGSPSADAVRMEFLLTIAPKLAPYLGSGIR